MTKTAGMVKCTMQEFGCGGWRQWWLETKSEVQLDVENNQHGHMTSEFELT
jgi:hypothetical protein